MQGEEEAVVEQLEVQAKYEGYINKQLEQVKKSEKMESQAIPEDIDYMQVYGLSNISRQSLQKVKPATIGQATRVSGVSPSDINVLLIAMEKQRRIRRQSHGE
jgi:tRNA uridine 5-carboxymethylaminomethyl modification enzyme